MKLGIMQPYFFPYLGHFSLIAAVDEWIVFDITQYTPKTWMNRNRILHPKEGWQYITVPLSNSSITIKTHEARILNLSEAKTNIAGKLSHYKKKAPYFEAVNALVNEVFDSATDDSLVHLNVLGLKAVCRYLDIPFNYRICSEMNLSLPDNLGPGDWALEICSQLGATSYINPAGGQDLFDPAAFARRGVSLQFAQPKELVYDTSPYQYESGLSILDVLMWNPPAVVAEAVRNGLAIKASDTCSNSIPQMAQNYQAGQAAPTPLALRTEEEVMSSWLTKGEPVVSICCATYNHVDYLEDALRGFIGQVTAFPFEVILRDDASTDGTTAIVRDYAKRYPNIIRPVIEEKNRYVHGSPVNLTTMLSFARGEFFALCAGDDFWVCPTKLEKQVALLRANARCVMCVAQTVEGIYKEGALICASFISGNDKELQYFDEITRTYFHPSSYLIRADILRAALKKYAANIPMCDTALRYMLINFGPFVFLREVMSVWRITGKGRWTGLDEYKQMVWEIELAESLYKYFEPEYKEYHGRSLIKHYRYIIGQDIRQFNLRRLGVNLPRYVYFAGRYGSLKVIFPSLITLDRRFKKIIRLISGK